MDWQAKIESLLPTILAKWVMILGIALGASALTFPDFLFMWLPPTQDTAIHLARWLISMTIFLITSIWILSITLKWNLTLKESNLQIDNLHSDLNSKNEELKKIKDEFDEYKKFHSSKPIKYPSLSDGSNSWMG